MGPFFLGGGRTKHDNKNYEMGIYIIISIM